MRIRKKAVDLEKKNILKIVIIAFKMLKYCGRSTKPQLICMAMQNVARISHLSSNGLETKHQPNK